jgi:hypothetical protein
MTPYRIYQDLRSTLSNDTSLYLSRFKVRSIKLHLHSIKWHLTVSIKIQGPLYQITPYCIYQDSRSALSNDTSLYLSRFKVCPTNKQTHLAAAASWFLELGADGSAATDLAVTSSFEDTMETFFKDTTICPCTSLSYNINHIDTFTTFSTSTHQNHGLTNILPRCWSPLTEDSHFIRPLAFILQLDPSCAFHLIITVLWGGLIIMLEAITLVCPAISMLTPSKSPNAVPKERDEAASWVGLRTEDTTSADASLRFAAAEFNSCCSCL